MHALVLARAELRSRRGNPLAVTRNFFALRGLWQVSRKAVRLAERALEEAGKVRVIDFVETTLNFVRTGAET